jgi:hypothetical protein
MTEEMSYRKKLEQYKETLLLEYKRLNPEDIEGAPEKVSEAVPEKVSEVVPGKVSETVPEVVSEAVPEVVPAAGSEVVPSGVPETAVPKEVGGAPDPQAAEGQPTAPQSEFDQVRAKLGKTRHVLVFFHAHFFFQKRSQRSRLRCPRRPWSKKFLAAK